ncbi:E3 ubiquitin-protein ligase [Tetrabaena socialis]|uniref:E3 ubiquitin-protein ligase n=1 Tax=Tetrabaena socialis TaxID=47790 RepID=A0A2J8A9R1_9CHLO|nr:E3 ubiquitin-protein ligase [Tetrabaena socialis]|eukprot:PNH09264.1 E3 ubiquitin-protein ligase [Tetrabaena socialis]
MSVTTRVTDDDTAGLMGCGADGGAQQPLLPLGLSPEDVSCPICVEAISDPFVTSCGHTFCYRCIATQLRHKHSCPSCGAYLTADHIYPNFLLNKALLAHPHRPPRPVVELSVRSKQSSLSYSAEQRSHLLAADYEGGVALWDTEAGATVQEYDAHERRVWGVDFSPAPSAHHCFASGSDDGLVKVWSTRQPSRCCLALEMRGNVCSVEWHPTDPNLLAVGSALHSAVVYDIRAPAAPLHTLLGHRRAVSYVRWLPGRPNELLLRTFTGHTNERNFVGLCAGGDYVACGSETHEVFVYYRPIARPAMSFSFAGRLPDADRPGGHFVTALQWRRNSPHLLAANSAGCMWLLGLQL